MPFAMIRSAWSNAVLHLAGELWKINADRKTSCGQQLIDDLVKIDILCILHVASLRIGSPLTTTVR